jgi:ubiquinone/menaquinone biosynthesis C-methylase UbiE
MDRIVFVWYKSQPLAFKLKEEKMKKRKDRICPVERADRLDTKFRRLWQNPRKILDPYISNGMTVLDFGCGPGYFTIDIAHMVGNSGRVIAADLQEGMLQKLKDKIHGTELEECITLHKSEVDKIGLIEMVDFALAFYVVHEIANQGEFFKELASIIEPKGRVLIVEPPFHVSKTDFLQTIKKAEDAGFKSDKGPKVILNKTVILKKN